MKNRLKTIVLCSLCLVGACKRESTTENAQKKSEEPPVTEIRPDGLLLPVSLESKTLKIELKYTENTSEISVIKGSDGYRTEVGWKDGLPVSYMKYFSDKQYELVDYQKASANGPRMRRFSVTGPVNSFTGMTYTLTYTGALLERLKYYNNNVQERQLDMVYEAGNCTGITERPAEGTSKEKTMKYDTRKGLFSNVKLAERILLECKYDFLKPGLNNLTGIAVTGSATGAISYSYTYNASGYPEEMVVKSGATEQRFRITYMSLKN